MSLIVYGYTCCHCEQRYYSHDWDDVLEAKMDYGYECRKCIEWNNAIAQEVLDSLEFE